MAAGMTVAQIAERVGGSVEGDGRVSIAGLAGLQEAKPGDLSFLANPRYGRLMIITQASAVVVSRDWTGACPAALIRVENPDEAFVRAACLLAPPPPAAAPGIHPSAIVAPGVELGADVSIGPYCVIERGARIGARCIIGAGCYLGEGTVLGENCRLYPHVSTREYTRIGARAIIHNGAVIGSDGFGYFQKGRKWEKIPQVGVVEIGDDVEIGANATIDRARFGKTVIGNGVKIDNLVQIAHNCRIGDNTALAAQVGIAGSATVGANVQLGGQAGVVGHLTVGDFSVVGGQAGVTKDVPPRTFVSGYPAMPHEKAKEIHAHVMRLPALKERVAEMERRLARLEKGVQEDPS